MDLTELPRFIVRDIHATLADGDTVIAGHFSHLLGVRNRGGWLYRRPGPSLVGGLSRVPSNVGESVEFRALDIELAPELCPGAEYPWIDEYWQAYHADMVLDGRWERREFSATPARYFRLGGVTGWQRDDTPLLDGAEDLGVRAGAWDHEHCELCNVRISAAAGAQAYVDPLDHWLCVRCYHRYAEPRDLSFLAEA